MSTSQSLANNNDIKNASRLQSDGTLIVDRNVRGAVYQFSDVTLGTPHIANLGAKCVCKLDFVNQERLSRTIDNVYLQVQVNNLDGTDTVVLPQGGLTLVEKMEFFIDDKYCFELKGEALLNIWATELNMQGQDVFLNSAFVRQEDSTNNGITIAAGSSKKVNIPLNMILKLRGNTLTAPTFGAWQYGEIKSIRVDASFKSEAASVAAASKICRCSTADVNMYTIANMSFSEVGMWYSYVNTAHPSDVVPFQKNALSANLPLSVVVPVIKDEVIYTGTVTKDVTSAQIDTNDIEQVNGIQYYEIFARKVPTAYNDAACTKKYSGYRYLKYTVKQKTAPNQTLDLTDEQKLKDYEYNMHKMDYGSRLPIEFYTTDHDFSNGHLIRTRLNMDYYAVNQRHESLTHINTNNATDQYTITVTANQTLSGTFEIVVRQVRYELYDYVRDGEKYRLIKREI